MDKVLILVEGITDKSFVERLPGLNGDRLEFPRQLVGGQEWAKGVLAERARVLDKVIICLDLDDRSPAEKFNEVRDHVATRGIRVVEAGPDSGLVKTEVGLVLFLPLGLPSDSDLSGLGINRHSFEDYLVRIALDDVRFQRAKLRRPLRDCLGQVLSAYSGKGISTFSSSQVYQLLKPLIGLPKHETGALSEFFDRADPAIVRRATGHLVDRLNSFTEDKPQ